MRAWAWRRAVWGGWAGGWIPSPAAQVDVSSSDASSDDESSDDDWPSSSLIVARHSARRCRRGCARVRGASFLLFYEYDANMLGGGGKLALSVCAGHRGHAMSGVQAGVVRRWPLVHQRALSSVSNTARFPLARGMFKVPQHGMRGAGDVSCERRRARQCCARFGWCGHLGLCPYFKQTRAHSPPACVPVRPEVNGTAQARN